MTDFRIPSSNLHATSMMLMNKIALTVRQARLKVSGETRKVNIASVKMVMVLKVVGLSLAFFFTRVWEYLKYPIDLSLIKHRIKKPIQNDIKMLSLDQQKAVSEKVSNKIKNENLQKLIDNQGIVEELSLASYASSYHHYGPVVLDWVKSLFETAIEEHRKLIFLARDGYAPYEVAKILKKQDPERYREVDISYVYFSRKVVENANDSPGLLEGYLKQHGIVEKDHCIFVDIGFEGSMINPVCEQLKKMDLDIKFHYLISHTTKAHGFIACVDKQLTSLQHAGQNRATHWLEDSHHGVINSPAKLIQAEDGKIYPNVMPPKGEPETCKKKSTLDYLLKCLSLEGVLDYAREHGSQLNHDDSKVEGPKVWRAASEKLREEFDKFLSTIYRGERYLYIGHK